MQKYILHRDKSVVLICRKIGVSGARFPDEKMFEMEPRLNFFEKEQHYFFPLLNTDTIEINTAKH